jgi:pantoate--beta-alanine ligase
VAAVFFTRLFYALNRRRASPGTLELEIAFARQAVSLPESGMRTITSPSVMQRLAQRWQARSVRIALVPTMGCLHQGHISLVKRARQRAGRQGKVVVSLYVNPTQFGPREDFARYPRDLARDAALCRAAGVDVLFAPTDETMYPGKAAGGYSTYVVEEVLSQFMEGRSRPTHFRGVTTVVAKLFHLVLPRVAVFGAKDWQQAAILQRMVKDLNFPVQVLVAPTVREAGGLAMSSRNRYLTGPLRAQALVLWQALQQARLTVRSARHPISAARLKRQLARQIERQPDARLDYMEFFAPDTLQPVRQVCTGTHMALAVFIGSTRLIDNAAL